MKYLTVILSNYNDYVVREKYSWHHTRLRKQITGDRYTDDSCTTYGSYVSARSHKTTRLALGWWVSEGDFSFCSPLVKLLAVFFYWLLYYFYMCIVLEVLYLQVILLSPIWPPHIEGKLKLFPCLKVLVSNKSLDGHQLHSIYCCFLKNKCKGYPCSKTSETKVLLW